MWIGSGTPLMNFLLSASRIVFSMMGLFITHMRSSVVLCCYCFISFLTSCVPNETKYPSLSYFSKSLFNALGNETATSKTNIMKTVYTHG